MHKPAAAIDAFPTLSLLKSVFFSKNYYILFIVLSLILSLSKFYRYSLNYLGFSSFFLAFAKYSSSFPLGYPLAIFESTMIKTAIKVFLIAMTGFYKFLSSTKWSTFKPFNALIASCNSGSAIASFSLH